MSSDSRLFYSFRSSTLFSICTVGLGMTCDAFLYAFVVPLLPSFLEHRANVPPQDIQRAISINLAIYAAGAALGSPIAGLIADRVSSRSIPFLTSLAFLAVGTAMFLTVQTMPLLLLARALQGLSNATVFTVGLAMLFDKVGAERMGVTMGSIFGVLGVSQLAAPTLGGWLYEKAGMGALRGIALGIIALDFLMRLAVIETPRTEIRKPDDSSTQQRGFTETDGGDISDISTQAQDPEQAPLLNQPTANAVGRFPLPKTLSSYVTAYPILILLRDPRLIAAEVVGFSQSFQFAAIDATLPPELATRLGFSSGPISLMILPWIIPFVIFDPIFGRVIDRIGTKTPALIGMGSWAVVLILMRVPIQVIENGHRNVGIGVWAGMMVLNGIAAAAVGSGGIVAAGKVADGYMKEHPDAMAGKHGRGPYAQLFAVNSIVYHIGLTVGPTTAGALRSSIGYANMNAVLAGVILVVLTVCYIYMDGWPVCGKGYGPRPVTDEDTSI